MAHCKEYQNINSQDRKKGVFFIFNYLKRVTQLYSDWPEMQFILRFCDAEICL